MSETIGVGYPSLTLTVNFSGSTWTDISEYIRSISIERGSSEETGKFPVGTMTVVLDNRTGRFTPANTSGPYSSAGVSQVLPEIGVRLKATYSATDYVLFAGIVEDWQDEFPMHGKDAVTYLTVVDYLAEVAAWEGTDETLVTEPIPSDMIAHICDEAGNVSTIYSAGLGDEQIQPIPLVGNGLDLAHLVVDSEGGALYYAPNAGGSDGGIRFISRSGRVSFAKYNTVQATFSSSSVKFRDPVVSSNRGKIVRQADLQRVGGTLQTSGSGTPKVARDDLVNVSDDGVKAVADLLVAIGDPADNYRVREVTVDPIRTASWATVLPLDMVFLCRVVLAPPVTGVTIDREVFMDGIRHEITISPQRSWSITYQFASATAWRTYDYGAWNSAVWQTDEWFF